MYRSGNKSQLNVTDSAGGGGGTPGGQMGDGGAGEGEEEEVLTYQVSQLSVRQPFKYCDENLDISI